MLSQVPPTHYASSKYMYLPYHMYLGHVHLGMRALVQPTSVDMCRYFVHPIALAPLPTN